jgi:hypothetical protein
LDQDGFVLGLVLEREPDLFSGGGNWIAGKGVTEGDDIVT